MARAKLPDSRASSSSSARRFGRPASPSTKAMRYEANRIAAMARAPLMARNSLAPALRVIGNRAMATNRSIKASAASIGERNTAQRKTQTRAAAKTMPAATEPLRHGSQPSGNASRRPGQTCAGADSVSTMAKASRPSSNRFRFASRRRSGMTAAASSRQGANMRKASMPRSASKAEPKPARPSAAHVMIARIMNARLRRKPNASSSAMPFSNGAARVGQK